jgi:hypothetical protein
MATDSRAYSATHVKIVDFIEAGRTKQSRNFNGSRRWSLYNSGQEDEYVELSLHGNTIAKHSHVAGWEINLCGWVTQTTMRVLGACTPARVSTRGGVPNIGGWVIPNRGWCAIRDDGRVVRDPATNRPINFEPHTKQVADNAAVRYINKHKLGEVYALRKSMTYMHKRDKSVVSEWALKDFMRSVLISGDDITSVQPEVLTSVLNATGAQLNEAVRVVTRAYVGMLFENMNSPVAYATERLCVIKEATA